MDFSDDAHLALAVAKSKQMLLGKKLSIARSNPNKSRKDSSGRDNQMEHGRLMHLYCLFTVCTHQGKHACVCTPECVVMLEILCANFFSCGCGINFPLSQFKNV